ncbi:MAG: nucleotidyltransferase family protein [Acutalibacteraceae bacterium]
MQISSLICEYNPFHNGHKKMLGLMRQQGATHIVACMSGNFTQRGEAAILDKTARTRIALQNGADLVIELDVAHATSSAENFAYGGVFLLNALGCIDTLTFGSECGDVDLLRQAAEISASPEVGKHIPILLKSGMTYAAAHQTAVLEYGSERVANIFQEPNNLLAVEYIKALNKCQSPIQPRTIQRIGVAHDAENTAADIASASYIRRLIMDNDTTYFRFVPESTKMEIQTAFADGSAPHSLNCLERTILYKLRTMSLEEIRRLPDVSEGLEYRIRSVSQSCSYTELLDGIKSKRYTAARLRRIILYALLGLKKEDRHRLPCYIRILGLNQRGREILKIAKNTARLPIYTRYADLKNLPPQAKELFELESRCDDIYALTAPKIQPSAQNARLNSIYMPL